MLYFRSSNNNSILKIKGYTMKKIMILLAAMAMSTLAIQAEEAQPVEMPTAASMDASAPAATVEDDKNATKDKS